MTKINVTGKYAILDQYDAPRSTKYVYDDLQAARTKAISMVEESRRDSYVIVEIIEQIRTVKPVVEVEVGAYEVTKRDEDDCEGISLEAALSD